MKRAAEVGVSYVRKPSSIQGTCGYKVCEFGYKVCYLKCRSYNQNHNCIHYSGTYWSTCAVRALSIVVWLELMFVVYFVISQARIYQS